MSRVVRADFGQPGEAEKETKVDEHYKSELEAQCRTIFLNGTNEEAGLEGHHAEKAARFVPLALIANRLQLGTRKQVDWTLSLPNESEVKISLNREPASEDFQCLLSLLEVVRTRTSKAAKRLTEEQRYNRDKQRVKDAVKDALIEGNEDLIVTPVPPKLAENAAVAASQSPLVRRVGNAGSAAQWAFTLPDETLFKIEFSQHPDLEDLDCAMDVIRLLQKRYDAVQETNPAQSGL